jgi:hypothetical protein
MKDDDRLFMKRSGFLEETYFTWSIVPLIGEDGNVVGLYNPAFELTRRKIAERRMLTLREVGEEQQQPKRWDFWGQVLGGLQYNEYDTPFVLLYSVSEVSTAMSRQRSPNSVLSKELWGSRGSSGRAATNRSQVRFGRLWACFREAMNTDHPVLLETDNGSLSPVLINGIDWRGFGDPCRAASMPNPTYDQ